MNHFYLNPKVKSNLGISFYEIKLKKIKLITKKILILNYIDSSLELYKIQLKVYKLEVTRGLLSNMILEF